MNVEDMKLHAWLPKVDELVDWYAEVDASQIAILWYWADSTIRYIESNEVEVNYELELLVKSLGCLQAVARLGDPTLAEGFLNYLSPEIRARWVGQNA